MAEDRAARIVALEAQLAELKADEKEDDRPLTRAEIRKLTSEEARRLLAEEMKESGTTTRKRPNWAAPIETTTTKTED